jgi:GNAT superfamily N-acetyltransferase
MGGKSVKPVISTMRPADIAFAVGLTDAERWGYLKSDFDNLMAFEPDGCFVARVDERPVGIITSTSYGPYAFIGTLIVRLEDRNRGIGESLLMHAMRHLQSKGVAAIELDGVFQATSLYRRLGFQDKYLSLRFARPPCEAPPGCKLLRPQPAQEIVDFDFRMTGIRRERILELYLRQYRDAVYMIEGEALLAYAFVRPRSGGSMAIGPLVSIDGDAAERIMTGIAAGHCRSGLSVGVPDSQRSMVKVLSALGFTYRAPSLRMYWGEAKHYETHIYAILSPEKG